MHAPVSVQALIDGWGCAPGPFLQNRPLACECMMMPCKERCDPSDSKAGIYCRLILLEKNELNTLHSID